TRCVGIGEIISAPEGFNGKPALLVPRGDGTKPAPAWPLKMEGRVRLYLCVMQRGNYSAPGNEWVKTSLKVKWKVPAGIEFTDEVYTKIVEAGNVEIPGHDGKDGPNFGVPHLVVADDPSAAVAIASDSTTKEKAMDYAAGIDPKDLVDNKSGLGYLLDYQNPNEIKMRAGMPNILAKLRAGKEVVVAYLGGSITQQEGWRVRTTAFLKQRFPKAVIREVNAGVSGTGSDYGVMRLEQDVLSQGPDLVFVEFAVNDGGLDMALIPKTMEGIVRKIWKRDPATDIVFVYTVNEGTIKVYRTGEGEVFQPTAREHERVAAHYGIPSINFGYIVADLEKQGKLIFRAPSATDGKLLFSSDGTHPKADGDQLYAGAVARAFVQQEKLSASGPRTLPGPLLPDNWENARQVPIASLRGAFQGRRIAADPASPAYASAASDIAGGYVDLIKRLCPTLLKLQEPGDYFTVRFEGVRLGIMDVGGPFSGQLKVTVDSEERPVVSRFTPHNDHMRQQYFYLPDMPFGPHTVTFRL
ncbi:MAG: SGNH/GDSL hydrolase family protein, partial [Spirochaetia bacterium]|nr:SGNH/GDSL hydrolase family protein [Spirochaetia bacterium]